MDIEELAKQLDTTIKNNPMDSVYQGITEQEAENRLKKYGPNALSERKTLPWFIKLLLCMTGLFNYVLWVGSAISFVAYGIQTNHNDKSNMYLGIILALLVIMTGSLSYYISSKSDDLMA
jgi:magnesium-transporting ATPase (P-type)